MPEANPYQPPDSRSHQDSDDEPVQAAPPPTESHERTLRYAQLGLRLLGIMFFVDGAGGIVGSFVYGARQSAVMRQAGYESLPDAYMFGWLASSAVILAAGFYLVIGGRWVLEKVFLPSPAKPVVEMDDEDG